MRLLAAAQTGANPALRRFRHQALQTPLISGGSPEEVSDGLLMIIISRNVSTCVKVSFGNREGEQDYRPRLAEEGSLVADVGPGAAAAVVLRSEKNLLAPA